MAVIVKGLILSQMDTVLGIKIKLSYNKLKLF